MRKKKLNNQAIRRYWQLIPPYTERRWESVSYGSQEPSVDKETRRRDDDDLLVAPLGSAQSYPQWLRRVDNMAPARAGN